MKFNYQIFFITVINCFLTTSCEKFVDIDTPDFQMVRENVFADDQTATAALVGIYNQLYNGTTYYSNGWQNSITVLAGMSADLMEPRIRTDSNYGPFWQNQISISTENGESSANLNLWSSAYNIIYLSNSVLEGLTEPSGVTEVTRKRLRGQALFIRAFTYFYLTNLYGDIPLLLTTDYQNNALAVRNTEEVVWNQLTADLDESILLLDGVENYPDGQRTFVNQFVVIAFRARVYLYQENWKKAEELSSQVIAQTGTYEILDNLDHVFLANSQEAIWQLSPKGRGNALTHTNEGSIFIMHPLLPTFTQIILSKDWVSTIETEDLRMVHWVGYNESLDNYFINKYKVMNSTSIDISEYSMVLRIAEQYLIRAEARARQGKLIEAINDVDKIRQRSNLELISEISPEIGMKDLLQIIMEERQKELFAEWGHRWLDLKRTGKSDEILRPIKPLWQDTDVLYPIPEQERLKNPNLSQNSGY